MPLSPTDQLHLNTAAGFLQIGEPMDAWHELEMIAPQARAQTEVLSARLPVSPNTFPPTRQQSALKPRRPKSKGKAAPQG